MLVPVVHHIELVALRIVVQQVSLDELGDHHLLDLLQLLVLLQDLLHLLLLLLDLPLLLFERFKFCLDLALPLLLH